MSNSNINYTVTLTENNTITIVITPSDLGVSASGKSHLFAKGTVRIDDTVIQGFDGATIALNMFGNKGKTSSTKKAATTVSSSEWAAFQAFKASQTGAKPGKAQNQK